MSTQQDERMEWALGLACLEAYAEREGHTDGPADHVEPITPDVMSKAADVLAEEGGAWQACASPSPGRPTRQPRS